MEKNERIRCLIIGSGPAGYTAAIYASRANLAPVLYEGMQPGGQLTTTSEVENFPGYPEGISGFDMMEDLKKQAGRFGADIRRGIATAADFSQKPYRITIDGEKTIEADTVIISTGASAKYVAVVGGGDPACEEAEYPSHLASTVYLIVRKNYLRASNIMQKRVFENPNIEILFETQAEGLFGENGVEGVHLVKGKDTDHEERYDLPIDGFFLAIGHKPNTDIFKGAITLDESGYIVTAPHTTETNIEGVFAAGDVADPRYRQAITAAASGCKAAIDAERYLVNNNL